MGGTGANLDVTVLENPRQQSRKSTWRGFYLFSFSMPMLWEESEAQCSGSDRHQGGLNLVVQSGD